MKKLITLLVLVALCTTASAAVSTLTVQKDTMIFDSWGAHDDKNYGAYTSGLSVREGGYNNRVMLEFDLSSISGTITNATVYMRNRWTVATNANVTVSRLTQAWVEGTGAATVSGDGATYDTYDGTNNWATSGGDYTDGLARSVTTVRGAYFGIDITSMVQYWIDNGGSNKGLIIVNDAEVPNFDINSKDEVSGTRAAYLVVDAVVPEPATMTLLAIGAFGVLARRRRR